MASVERPAAGMVAVCIVECPAPGRVTARKLQLPAGSTLAGALLAAGIAWPPDRVGIWGRVRPSTTPLREGDRIELYRELRADPKDARRERARRGRGGLALSGSRTR